MRPLFPGFPIWSLPSLSFSAVAAASAVITLPSSFAAANTSEALSYYISEVDAGVQSQCLVCHRAGGVAQQAGARLVFGDDSATNHNAFLGLLGLTESDSEDSNAEVIAFVERFYVLVLGRASDQAGLDGWVNALLAGTFSGADVAEAFFLSGEYLDQNTTDDEFVETLYQAFFNRDSDAAGKQGWLTELQRGVTRAQVIDGFSGSAEFAALAAAYGISATGDDASSNAEVAAFVERFYVLVLGRASDEAGLDGWVKALLAGTLSGADVAEAFFLSGEYLDRNTSDDEFVETLYRALFNRNSDFDGKQGWLGELQRGASRGQVIDGFSGSAEFAALAAAYGINATRADLPKAGDTVAQSVAGDSVDGQWILSKVVGEEGHGGGAVLTPSSPLYKALETYLGLLGLLPTSDDNGTDFWRGTAAEDREITLRRASLLFAGDIPSDDALSEAKKSDAGLRQQILGLMQGAGFRNFIIRNADDRLLVQGLLNGVDFSINVNGRYPELGKLALSLPNERPEEYQDFHEKPFLTQGDAGWEVMWAISQEPLELIAHVIMNDLPYGEILTADYTMVNAFTDLAYRSGSGFSHDFADERGFYDRSQFTVFKPGYNNGYVPRDEQHFTVHNGWVTGFSGYFEVPHAGILSTQAWLARYPSTDTNRNRARARWTYFHFLGIDIEKSAPRSTDPEALADTNNPTMNNTACTVCHERLDPVAGAYQSFGDLGGYLDQWGGRDSLAESYKYPEWYGGQPGSTLYQEGDTWYRDMRAPGLEGQVADDHAVYWDSLQWLGEQIAADPRFATATVRFWWPAIYGSDPLIAPTNSSAPDYQEQLNAFNAQEAEIGEIALQFEASGYNARSLFADMVMSRWYRHSEVTDPALVESRLTELATVGSGRLLTPEELDTKNRAIFGRSWQQRNNDSTAHDRTLNTALVGRGARFKGFYGGIDGAGVTVRNREMTPLMSNVTEAMAVELACQVVVEDFQRPRQERQVFTYLDRNTIPGQLAMLEASLPGKVAGYGFVATHELLVSASTVSGPTRLRISDITRNSYGSLDGQGSNADLVIQKIEIRDRNTLLKRIEADEIPSQPGFEIEHWHDDHGNSGPRGQFEEGIGWVLHENAWVEFSFDLLPGTYEIKLFLGTQLFENNVNDAMVAEVSLTATDNFEDTAAGQAIKAQIASIFLRATHQEPSEDQLNSMMAAVTSAAAEAAQRNSWFNSSADGDHCATWNLFSDQQDVDWGQVHQDPHGMMRGWTVFVHAVLTSWGYLHD